MVAEYHVDSDGDCGAVLGSGYGGAVVPVADLAT